MSFSLTAEGCSTGHVTALSSSTPLPMHVQAVSMSWLLQAVLYEHWDTRVFFKLWWALDICPGVRDWSRGNSVLLASKVMGTCLASILRSWGLEGHLWWRQLQGQSPALWTFPGSVGQAGMTSDAWTPSISCVFLILSDSSRKLLVPCLPLLVQILRLREDPWESGPAPFQ